MNIKEFMEEHKDGAFWSPLETVTRVEVIERGHGRYFTDHNASEVVLSLQDDGRTLKIFIKEVKSK